MGQCAKIMSMWQLYPLLFFFVFLVRFVIPLKAGKGIKLAIALFALAIAQQRFIVRFLFQNSSSSELPPWVTVLQGLLLATLVFLTAFTLLRDIIGLGLLAYRRKYPKGLFSSWRSALGIGGLSLTLSALGVWQGIRVPYVYTREIALPNLPKELDGFTIVQLTDLHISRLFSADWVKAVADRVNALEPDVIAITGDIVDGPPSRRIEDVRPLGGLNSHLGVFAVHGNHDFSSYQEWLAEFNELGIQVLVNEHAVLEHNGALLILAGVTDSAAARVGTQPDIAKTLLDAPKDATKILMSHKPGNAGKNASAGIDLQLSGHTHGGQIAFLGLIVKNANNGYVSGLYEVGKMRLYLSNGTGVWTGFPIRLGRPAEITRIILRCQSYE